MENVGNYTPPYWYNVAFSIINFGKNHDIPYNREIIHYEDGTEFSVDWFPMKPKDGIKKEIRICLHFPGIGAGSHSKVSKGVVYKMMEAGYISAVINPRGYDTPLTTAKLWNAGLTEDAYSILENLYNVYTHTKLDIIIIAYSASTNIICKTLLKWKDSPIISNINAVVLVSVTYDYIRTRENAENTWLGSILSMFLCYTYKSFLLRNPQVHMKMNTDILNKVLSTTYVSEYDKAVYPLLGYTSEEECYEDYSAFEIHNINIPILAIQPIDDFIQGNDIRGNIPLDKYTTNRTVIYMETSHGNHLGFYEGGLLEAFSNATSYTYPPRVAIAFHNACRKLKYVSPPSPPIHSPISN